MSQNQIFRFALSEPGHGLSTMAQATIHLSQIAERLANEDRTLVVHQSGRPENVAEHSNMLAIIAPAIAEQFFETLDANLVARFATIHDSVEAYVGDTPTHNISEQGFADKEILEAAGLAQLKKEFKHLPKFVDLVETYEAQVVPEARFVRVMDKCMPAMIHFLDGGVTLKAYATKQVVLENSAERAATLRKTYPDFEELITLREELSERLVSDFLS